MPGIDFAPPIVNPQPFQIRPPEYSDPLQTLAQLGQLRNQGLQQQTTGLQIQQQQQDLKDQQIMGDYFRGLGQQSAAASAPQAAGDGGTAAPISANTNGPSPVPGGIAGIAAPAGVPGGAAAARSPMMSLNLQDLASRGLSGKALQALQGQQLKYAQDYMNLTKEQQAVNDKNHADAAQALKGIYYAPADQQQIMYPGVRDTVRKLAPDDPAMMPDQLPADPAQAKALLETHLGFMGAHDSIVANAKSAADTRKALADAAETNEKLPGLRAEGRIAQAKADALDQWKQNPQTGLDTIHQATAFNQAADQNFTALYKDAMSRGDFTGAQAALTSAIEFGNRSNPTTMAQSAQQHAAEAALTARATAGTEVSKANQEEAFRNTLQTGNEAQKRYADSLTDMKTSLSTADTIGRVLDLSNQGNAVAGQQLVAMVPEFTNAVQNIKRMAAVQGDKGLASTADKLSSEVSSLVQGQPLSEDLRKQIAPYVQTIASGAVNQHNANVAAINKAYPRTNYQPEYLRTAVGKGGHRIGQGTDGRWYDIQSGKVMQ